VDDVLALSRLLVAVPLAVAGFRSIADSPGIRRAIAIAEVVVAFGLTQHATAWWSALLALCLLAVGMVLAAGAFPSIARGFTLAIPAGVVLWMGWTDSGPDITSWLSGLAAGQLLAIVVCLVLLGLAVNAGPGQRPAAVAPPRGKEEEEEAKPSAAPLIHGKPELTIGMATYDDFDGVYFTLQALRLYHDMENVQLLVVDNYGCTYTRDFVRDWARSTYVLADDVVGTAAAKDLVFRNASGSAVLCCDSHVLFEPGVIARLKRFYRDNPGCDDLLQGPLVYDDGELVSTHFEPVWRDQMWGVWATDGRGVDGDGEAFEIPMQGLGVFSCRADAWLGFHPGFRGFGGEEGYLHTKFQRAGRRCLCLPWLRWMHRFGRPRGIPYPLTVEDKLRNYLLGHTELGLDVEPVLTHFSQYLPADRIARLADEASSTGGWNGSSPPRPARAAWVEATEAPPHRSSALPT
jgi:hypothetical protein